MAKAFGGILLVALLAKVGQTAPAPLPKRILPPTVSQLKQRLRARGIDVQYAEFVPERKGYWIARLGLTVVDDGRVCEKRIAITVRAVDSDERAAFEALLARGQDAAQLWVQYGPSWRD